LADGLLFEILSSLGYFCLNRLRLLAPAADLQLFMCRPAATHGQGLGMRYAVAHVMPASAGSP
jgi:hypothetical protein